MRFMGIKFDALHAEVSKFTESTKFSPLNLKLHGHEILNVSLAEWQENTKYQLRSMQ